MTTGDAQREFECFRDYYIAQPGTKGRRSDWLATWRNWIRRGASKGAKANRQAQIDQEWEGYAK